MKGDFSGGNVLAYSSDSRADLELGWLLGFFFPCHKRPSTPHPRSLPEMRHVAVGGEGPLVM